MTVTNNGENDSHVPGQITSSISGETPLYIKILITTLYVLIFTLGICGNVLVTIVISRNRELRNSTNYFLFNLSAADIMVLVVTMPTALMEVHTNGKWYLGEDMCEYSLIPIQ